MVPHRGRCACLSSKACQAWHFLDTIEGAQGGRLPGLSARGPFSRPQGHASGGGAVIIIIIIIIIITIIKICSHPGSCGFRLLDM